MPYRLLVVEDEKGIRVALKDRLRSLGYEVEEAADGNEAFNRATQGGLDLIVLDLILPGKDGIEVCRELRRMGIDTPVIMLTARAQLDDKLKGFSVGADDYVPKPFDIAEVLARIKALLRRSTASLDADTMPVLRFGNVRVDPRQAAVWVDGEQVRLSVKEYDLLHCFITHPNGTLTREQLLRRVWNHQSVSPTRTVDVHVGWLRRKLKDDSKNPRWIRTIHGRGYRFVPD